MTTDRVINVDVDIDIQLSETRGDTEVSPENHSGPYLVELIGIEPTTSGLQSQRSPN